MSVLLETSVGDIVIDLRTEEAPIACKSFLKLCKVKYYNHCLFHNVQAGALIQTGDPTGSGTGGSSLYGLLYGDQARFFEDEFRRSLRHDRAGVVSMASSGPNTNGSQYFITVGDHAQEHLDDKYTIFGEVAEGLDVARKIGAAYCDPDGRPFRNIRVRHTIVLDDPFDDPPGLEVPDASPPPSELHRQQDRERLADDEELGGDGEDDPVAQGGGGAASRRPPRHRRTSVWIGGAGRGAARQGGQVARGGARDAGRPPRRGRRAAQECALCVQAQPGDRGRRPRHHLWPLRRNHLVRGDAAAAGRRAAVRRRASRRLL